MHSETRLFPIVGLLIAVGAAFVSLPLISKLSRSLERPRARQTFGQKRELDRSYGPRPLRFERNVGQTEEDVQFVSHANGYTLFLSATEATLKFSPLVHNNGEKTINSVDPNPTDVSIHAKLIGANPRSRIYEQDELTTRTNYFLDDDRRKWRTNIRTYRSVRLEQTYPGIDLVYRGNPNDLEYDFLVKPGSDPNVISFQFLGTDKIELDATGALVLSTKAGEVYQRKPEIYQEINGSKKPVEGGYVVKAGNRVGFEIGPYDHTEPLTIDPVIVYSTGLGGAVLHDIAIDNSGNAYVTGDGPSITKLDPTGNVLYSTFLGHGLVNAGFGSIAVDASGNAYICGAASSGFPTTAGTFQPNYINPTSGNSDAFVTKVDAAGNLVYSTYLGESDVCLAVAVDPSGNAYVAGSQGSNGSSHFPTTAGAFQTTTASGAGGFVAKLNSDASQLIYGTYLGENAAETGIAVNNAGEAYVTGHTSPGFPTTPGAFQTTSNAQTAFVTKLSATGSELIFSTLLGGDSSGGIFPSFTQGTAIAIDSAGNSYLTGTTSAKDFPTTAGAVKTTLTSFENAFVTKVDSSGTSLVYSTYLGGSSNDQGFDISVDCSGNAYVTGIVQSDDFPTTPDAFQTNLNGHSNDAFVTKVNSAGSGLDFSTYLGGYNAGFGIAANCDGDMYVTGGPTSCCFGGIPAYALRISFASSNQPPAAICRNVTATAGSECLADASIDNSSFDPDSGDTITVSQSPAGPYSLGSTNVTLTVTDSHGASSSCAAIVSVVDTTAPTITCPTNITAATDPGVCSANVNTGSPTASDNCGAPGVSGLRNDGRPLTDPYPIGTTSITWTASDSSHNTSSCQQLINVAAPQLTSLGPARVWIGLKNSDDVGTRFDLLAEVFKNGVLVGSGQLNGVAAGGSGFNNAILDTITLAQSQSAGFCAGENLSLRLSVRIASNSSHVSGTARLWFNDAAANSRVTATIGGATSDFFLRSGLVLATTAGAGPRNNLDVMVNRNQNGNPFKPFGTWTYTF